MICLGMCVANLTEVLCAQCLKTRGEGTFWIKLHYFQKLVSLDKKYVIFRPSDILFCLVCSSKSF